MDTSELEAAGRAVSEAAAAGPAGRAGSGKGWGAAHVLAHLAAANRNAAELAARVLAGAESATFTNQAALEDTYLDAIVRAAGGQAGVLEEFERSTAILTATCAALQRKALETPIEARFWDDGTVVFEQTVPLEQVLTIVRGHMEGHAAQIREFGA